MLAQKTLCVITYSREELLYVRTTSTYQHYDQEYNFSEADSLSTPPRAFKLIPEANPKQCRWRTGRRSGLLVRPRRPSHHSPLLSILLANVQSLDNKVDEIRARVAFQREIRDCNILCFTEICLSQNMLSELVKPPRCSVLIVDFRRQKREHIPFHIDGTVVETVDSFKFLDVHITDNLKWSTHRVMCVVKNA